MITPSHQSTAPASRESTSAAIPSSAAPMTRLETGPASAISASSRGERESDSMLVAPPKMKSVIPATFRPKRRATSACENSCARTDAKKRSAVAAPSSQYCPTVHPGMRRGKNASARLKVSRKAITSQLG